MPDPAADYLRTLTTSDRARAAAWDAVYAPDDATAETLLAQLPFSDDVRANLWDLRQGGTLSGTVQDARTPTVEEFMDPQARPEGSAVGRFLRNAGEVLNPVTAVKGIAQAVANPIDTLSGIYNAQGQQFDQAVEAYRQGRPTEMLGRGAAAFLPVIGPAAAEAGEQMASGDVAGGLGRGAGLVMGGAAARPVTQAAGRAAQPVAQATARRLYQSALKPSKATLNDVRPAAGMSAQETLLQTGLDEAIPITARGARKVENLIDSLNAEVQSRVAKIQASGEKVDPALVEQAIDDVVRDFTAQVNAQPDLAAIETVRQNFRNNPLVAQQTAPAQPANFAAGRISGTPAKTQPGPIDPVTAQQMKTNTYKGLRGKYDKERSGTIEAEKAGGRGLREGLEQAGQRAGVDDIAAVNAREGALISLEHALADAMRRRGNYDVLGLKPAVGATAAVASETALPFLVTLVDRFPGLVSRTGIWINRAGRMTGRGAQRAARGATVGTQMPSLSPTMAEEDR